MRFDWSITWLARVASALGLVGLLLVGGGVQAFAAPPNRGYELVSPQAKNGGDIERDIPLVDYAVSGAADGGGAVAYGAQSQFAGPQAGAPYTQYVSRRTDAGWLTRNISPRVDADVIAPPAITVPRVPYLSPNLRRAVMITNVPLTIGADAKLNGSWGLYLWDDALASPYRLISDPFTPLPPDLSGQGSRRFEFAGASEDMRQIVFTSRGRQLTLDGAPSDDTAIDSGVYKWSEGELKLVSALPDGQPAPGAVGGSTVIGHAIAFDPGAHLVSDDGGRVFFTVQGSVGGSYGTLYVREEPGQTIPLALSQRAVDDPPTPGFGRFWAAEAATGSRALFSSGMKLTEDAGAEFGGCDLLGSFPILECKDDLYLWDRSAPVGARLTNLTPEVPGGAGALGLAAASRDLRRAYFVATAALTGDAVAGQPNLYAWGEGTGIDLVATLSEADAAVWSTVRSAVWAGSSLYRDARTTPDGSRLVFVSSAALAGNDTAGFKQVYLYDAGTEHVQCVSCGSSAASTGNAGLYPIKPALSTSPTTPFRLTRNLSSDGSAVVFESDEALSPADSNGRSDVYEWREGTTTLISSGQSAGGSQFVDASADGLDIFFTTRERLVGSDKDDQKDLYDARVGGGFPEAVPPVLCQGDECQGAPPAPPSLAAPVTSTFVGDGNSRPAKRKASKHRAKKCARGFVRKKVRGKSRCVKQHRRPSKPRRRG